MRGFKYIVITLALTASASMWGQYNPTNPSEPGAPVTQYTLMLQADPSGGGSFNLNATSNHAEGETFNIQANAASNFTFVSWEADGEVVSTTARFSYRMPAKNVNLIAHFRYTPSSPAEPAEPNIPAKPVYSNIYLSATPRDGGSFNISSGNSYEVGSSVRLTANPASNFSFVNWTQNGEIISTDRTFNYVVLEGIDANQLVANFTYTPGSPGEPTEAVVKKPSHRVYLLSDPVQGGYFNVASGNQYEEGSVQTFRAYNNEWYTFVNWTKDGEVVSTSSSYSMTIPTEDVTLTAHYTYCYNPGSPGEPGQSTTKHLNVYGMTATGALGQNVVYPVFLENTEDVNSVTVVVHFPTGFKVNTSNAVQAERAAGHQLTVTALDGNAYRFDLIGNDPLTGQNGKIFDVPVTISSIVEANQSYQVELTNAARINSDGSKEVINTRNGYIYVEELKEDGLYAQYSYEKLQNRVKFMNLSSDKAVSYLWDFGDGSTSTEKNPLHVFASSGYYDVLLKVKGQTGTDEAQMTVLINDEDTWIVDGTFFLDTEERGVRYFTNADDLFTFITAHPIGSDLKISVKQGLTFDYGLSEENLTRLTTLQTMLSEGDYLLTIVKNGDGSTPTLNFGKKGADISTIVVDLFIALGQNMACNDVNLQLWGIGFNPSKLEPLKGQTVLSGQPTVEVDLLQISTDLTFQWTAISDTETAMGYPISGNGNIPSMTAISGSAKDCHITYNIIANYKGTKFLETTHTITLQPALEGKFTELFPANDSELETTTVTLSWNHINNAVYDVYLWNASNQRPTTPVAEGISETSFTSQNFCQNNHSYKWQVVARNVLQQLISDTMRFTVKILPDLHIYDLHATTDLQAGRKVTIEWTVKNDGAGSTDTQSWQDRLWIVPDIYGGTNQNSCKLLATVPNVCSLASGQQYTGRVEVTLDEYTYGSFFLLVASDMSSVNLIDWTSVGGTIVTPYTPILGGNASEGTYAHLFATTEESGNQLKEHGETTTRSDNFFYQKVEIAAPSLDETDWLILKAAYEQMGSGEGWIKPWNFDSETRSLLGLPGVQLREGRVVGIDLSGNNLSGSFPVSLLKLPRLETLNLKNNDLAGDIDQTMKTFMEQNPSQEITVKHLNVSVNNLSGNIGLFAQYCPQLESLNASSNNLEEVVPMISTEVSDLNLSKQNIEKVVEIHLRELTEGNVAAKIPSILLYDHKAQSYTSNFNLLCTTKDQSWGILIACQNGTLTIPYVTEQNAYYGQSGDTLNVAMVDSKRQPLGSSFRLKMDFGQGDANFDGNIDILDLQSIINYAFEDYNPQRAFNYTAANLWVDSVINVQDVICMANLLMSDEPDGIVPVHAVRTHSSGEPSSMDATLYMQDGQLLLNTTIPVSAFDVTISGARSIEIDKQLEQTGMIILKKTTSTGVHIIGYSLSGLSLPVGNTTICSVSEPEVRVAYAMLADANAENISVQCSDTLTDIRVPWMSDDGMPDSDEVYRIPIGRQHAIVIKRDGRKVIKK